MATQLVDFTIGRTVSSDVTIEAGAAQTLQGVFKGKRGRVAVEIKDSDYPALIRQARIPGQAQPWKQPSDQFDAYKLLNPFTGKPDEVTHAGKTWKVTLADGAGNNVWEPGQYGWAEV